MDYTNNTIKEHYDVIVCGGGPAGFAAAYSAAKEGAKTILIEQLSSIGGMATSGMMSHWTGDSEGPLLDLLLELAKDTNTDYNYYQEKVLKAKNIINPEKLKLVMFELLEKVNVDILLYTMCTSVIKEGDTVKGIIINNKSGEQKIYGDVVIDATGDGDIAYQAGAEFVLGRKEDNKMQPATLMFKIGGVDYENAIFPGEFEDNIETPNGKIQDLAKQYLDAPMGHVLLYPTSLPGVVTVNMTNCINVNGTLTEEITRAEISCRKQIPKIVDFIKKYVPGYENCYLLSTASLIGIRETRHFVGEYTITEEDIQEAKKFEDWITTKCYFNFDIHSLVGPGLDKNGAQSLFEEKQKEKYTIPIGTVIPKKIENLLLCGRNISGTHKAHSNYRVMPICINIGEGVGILASIASKHKNSPRTVDVKEVQKILIERGIKL